MFQYSIICRLFYMLYNRLLSIKNLMQGSLIIVFILKWYQKIEICLSESIIIKIANFFKKLIWAIFSGSKIYGYITKKDKNFLICDESVFYKVLNNIFNYPINLMERYYQKFDKYLNHSILIVLFKKLLRKFEIILSSVLLVTLLVPDQQWYNIYLVAIVGIVFILYCLRVVMLSYEGFDIKAVDFVFFAFFICVLFSVFISNNMNLSMKFASFYLINFLLVILLVSSIKTSNSLKNFISIYILGIFLTTIYGIWQAATGAIPFDPSFTDVDMNQGMPGRIYSTMGNANNYAELLIMTFPFYLANMFSTNSYIKKGGYIAMFGCLLIALAYTGSRSGWLAFLIVSGIIILYKEKRLIPVIMILGILSIPFMPDFILDRFTTIFHASSDSSTMYRVKIFNTVLPMIQDYWHTGIGLGTDIFMRASEDYYHYTQKTPLHTHILYTQLLLEIGVVGLFTFLWFIIRTLKGLAKNIGLKSDVFLNNVLIASFSSSIGILVIGLIEYPWYYPRIMFFFWVNIGIALIALNIINRKKLMPVKS